MSAVTIPTRPHSPWRDAAAFVWGAWSATTWRLWAWVFLLGVLLSLMSLPPQLEMYQKYGWPRPAVAAGLMSLPILATVMMFLSWVLADAGGDTWAGRRRRLAYALFGGAAVTTVVAVALWHQLGGGEMVAHIAAERGKQPMVLWLMLIAEYINMLLVSAMVFAVAELLCLRARTQRAFEATVRQQASLERQVLESRLSAMQAQVEPRFLFDTLVDIEALYEKDPLQAAGNLDRLIAYLRAALPRLRETGSTVEAELDLVAAYLQVVTALRGGRPQLMITLAEDCRRARFYPMLLLPLVQRAVRHPSGMLPERIDIDARQLGQETVVKLRLAPCGGCGDDPELLRVRERLAGLYGAAASLECVETAEPATELTLRLPTSRTAPDR